MASSAPSSPSPHQQQFCLRWNNHQSALVSVFDHLLQSEAFVDVTLAVEGLLLRAHKLVLSACSPYFQAVFASHPAKHPIIILKDVRYADLRALLDFMYRGEVAVDQDRLPAFLRLAESLKIRGLAEFCEESLSQATGSQPPIFDSLLDTQKSNNASKRGVNHQPTVIPPNSSAVEVLPVQRGVMDFSTPTGLVATTRSSSSLSGSNKRPSSPQTYAHHRRKRGRPPRQSFSESAGLNLIGSEKSISPNVKSSDSARGGSTSSPEVMEMNVDMPDGGGSSKHNESSSAPTNSSAHDNSLTAQDDEKGSRDSSPSVVPPTLFGNGKLNHHSEQDLDPLASPLPGTSSHADFDLSRRGGKSGKGSKRARGRPRGYGRNAGSLDRSSSSSIGGIVGGASADSLEDLAGPSGSNNPRDSSTPDRTLLGSTGTHLHHHNRDSGSTEQLQEMSIRGLNLFRYASVSEEGMYRCLPCEKDHVTRTFKNKYSFQRHAYLYHEGNQRKVFPCLVCGREFSRPDKLKHHLKTVHDYAVPREYSNAYYALP